jgi:hypothetical protein
MEWEPGSNRVLDVPATAAEMQVSGQWGETGDTETLEVRGVSSKKKLTLFCLLPH